MKNFKSPPTDCSQSWDWNLVFSIIIKLAFQHVQGKTNCWRSFAFCVRLRRCHLQAGGLFHSQAFRCSFSAHLPLDSLPEKVMAHTTASRVKNWPACPFCKKGPTSVTYFLMKSFCRSPPTSLTCFLGALVAVVAAHSHGSPCRRQKILLKSASCHCASLYLEDDKSVDWAR